MERTAEHQTIVLAAYAHGGKGAVWARVVIEARALASAGHRVIVVADQRHQVPAGIEIVVPPNGAFRKKIPGIAGEIVNMLYMGRLISKMVRRVQTDVLVFHASTLVRAARTVSRRSGIRTVFVVHALIQDKIEAGANPYGWLQTAIYVRANREALRSGKIVCVSNHISRQARRGGADPRLIAVIPNPIDTEVTSLGGPRTIDVLYAGRLSPEKGADILISALTGLPHDTNVKIAGEGPERAQLESLASCLPMSVEFLGWVERSELRALMQTSRLVVVPSRSEAQGMVVIEALACGAPVIGSDVGGIPESIQAGQNGWIVSPDSPHELSVLLLDLLADKEALEGMRGAAQESIADFTLDRMRHRITSTYLNQ